MTETLVKQLPTAGETEFQAGVEGLEHRQIRKALDHLQQAELLGYDACECASRRWYCRMLLGDFGGAWRESASIAARRPRDPNRLWDGLPFVGKRVMVRCLHGYGDAIQFIRYAGLLRQVASRVIVETHPEMVSLLERALWVDEVTTWEGGASRAYEWDRQIEVMELPRAFRTELGTIPGEVPYISPSVGAVRQSRRLLGESRLPRVGILWASGDWDPSRSVPFERFMPILNFPRVSFYSFQRGTHHADLARLSALRGVHDTARHSPEIVDTAADLMNMDLVITVDTMLAHLAGALGRRVWTLLPWDADWRWMMGRRDTPWYPTMRLFRQPVRGDWMSPVREVVNELGSRF